MIGVREIAIGVLVLAVAGQQVRVSNEKAAHQKTKADNYLVLKDLEVKTRKAYQAAVAEDAARKAAVAALDEKHTKELNNEKAKLEKLRADVAAGRVGLRVNAKCPAPTGTGVPQASSSASVADAAAPRLTDSAQRDYFRLLDRIAESKQQVVGLQDYIRGVCLK